MKPSQVDADGFQYSPLDTILAHKTDEKAVTKSEKYHVNKKGRRPLKKTTTGWFLKVMWKVGMEKWISLKDLKNQTLL